MYNECVIVMIWFTILWFWFEKWDVVETFSRCVQCYTSRTQPACWEKRRNRVNEFNNIVLPMVLWVNDDGYQLIRFTPLTQFYKWPNNHLATGMRMTRCIRVLRWGKRQPRIECRAGHRSRNSSDFRAGANCWSCPRGGDQLDLVVLEKYLPVRSCERGRNWVLVPLNLDGYKFNQNLWSLWP